MQVAICGAGVALAARVTQPAALGAGGGHYATSTLLRAPDSSYPLQPATDPL